ncbi:hypothetical protein GZH47_08240 [Paenibacillus rhizovicinus]|uniref:Uncharacterized protein n=1 Tax=Paenibacillus rhizovicinus TaxID=2704463 RepID=A0A6C0NYQ6_9BACL|nr:hypothetical protein [Paenibacillus rhizovicinus]QHW30843.1 hypothetical protein GZH47_08240 [Paenibacillus rhizovicinus]
MVKQITDKNVQELVDSLHLANEVILERFEFTIGGNKLTVEESISFIQFIRDELRKKEAKK